MKRLTALIRRYNIISFDIFDTLLKRDVFSPKDVFQIVERKFDQNHNGVQSGFAQKRINAERNARSISSFDEVTLEEIYNCLEFSDEYKKDLLNLELEVESSVLHRNSSVCSLYEECIKTGKTVYIVSDMYLPAPFLNKILEREGLVGYKKLYLSCDFRKTKRSGKLFTELCSSEGIDPKTVLHIGDSRYADYIGPRKTGMRSFHITRKTKNTIYMGEPDSDRSTFDERCLYSFINSRIQAFSNRNIQLGYEVLGPIIYYYCQWLHNEVKTDDSSRMIWFAARDMYLFERAFGKMFPHEKEYVYVYLSRKSLRPMYTQATGDITKSGDILARGYYSLEDIIQYTGYTLKDVSNSIVCDKTKKYDARELSSYPEVIQALSSPIIQRKERELSEIGIEYLSNNHLFDKDIIFADVGWHGTTQLLLSTIQNNGDCPYSVFGMYIGCLDGTNDKIGKDKYRALLFDEDHDSWFKKGIILFEALILAPHGSTTGYRKIDNIVEPVVDESENVPSIVLDIQDGAMRFIEDFSQSILNEIMDISNAHFSRAFEKLICEPQREDVESIGDLDYDNFYCRKLAQPQSLIHYITHYKDLYDDLKYSPWRIGFLYRLLKVRLPYAKVYSFARKRQGKMT